MTKVEDRLQLSGGVKEEEVEMIVDCYLNTKETCICLFTERDGRYRTKCVEWGRVGTLVTGEDISLGQKR